MRYDHFRNVHLQNTRALTGNTIQIGSHVKFVEKI